MKEIVKKFVLGMATCAITAILAKIIVTKLLPADSLFLKVIPSSLGTAIGYGIMTNNQKSTLSFFMIASILMWFMLKYNVMARLGLPQ